MKAGVQRILQGMTQQMMHRLMHRMAREWRVTATVCVISVAACAHPTTSNTPTPSQGAGNSARPPAAGATAGAAGSSPAGTLPSGIASAAPTGALPPPPRYVTGHSVYEITSWGTVLSPGDSVTVTDTTSRVVSKIPAPPDTITTATKLVYEARWSGSDLRLTGEVAAQVTEATTGLKAASQSGAPVVAFNATIDSASGMVLFAKGVDSAQAAGQSCVSGGPSVDQAREVATERPRSLDPGATWQDTLVDKGCLADIPLVTRATRVFTVSSEPVIDPVSGAQSVLVSHTSKATMIGGGAHLGRQITLNGQGDGTTEQYYDRVTGVMLSAHTVAALQLDVGTGGHVQRLIQNADWHAKLISYSVLGQ